MALDDEKRERLSALVDGELPRARAIRAVDELIHDERLSALWGRYHLVGDVIRKATPAGGETLASRVRAAVEREPAAVAPRRLAASLMRPALGAALAASVAVVAILAVRTINEGTPGAGAELARSSVEAGAVAPSVAALPAFDVERVRATNAARAAGAPRIERASASLQWHDAGPDVVRRLNGYLVNHSEYLGNGTRGLLPYVRIVGNEARE